jgi:hypothetical protein
MIRSRADGTTAASSTPYRHTLSYNMLGNITGFITSTGATSTYAYAETNYANPHAVTSVGGTRVARRRRPRCSGSSPGAR